MNGRPSFSPNMGLAEFQKHYWYKAELAALCRTHGLPPWGTKAECVLRITAFLSGAPLPKKTAPFRSAPKVHEPLSLQTTILEAGLTFNAEVRRFFADYFGVKKFSFTKELCAAVREAKRAGSRSLCIADLVEIYKNKTELRRGESLEASCCLWNGFVRSFHRDPESLRYSHPLKAAAILWAQVRDNPGPKAYTPGLLRQYAPLLEAFEKYPTAVNLYK